jgi:uncharacterized protein (TIGR02466 family)
MSNKLVKDWIKHLSQSTEYNNGIAKCPFAEQALNSGEVKTTVSKNLWEDVFKECFNFKNTKLKVSMFIDYNYSEDYPLLDMQCKTLNKFFAQTNMDIWLLAYYRPKEKEYTGVKPEGAIIFVQKWSDLENASQKLEKLGYYKNYNLDEYNYHVMSRRNIKVMEEETSSDIDNKETINVENHFCTQIYSIHKPEFLSSVKKVSKKYIKEIKQKQNLNSVYPVIMSGSYYHEPSIQEFCNFVGNTAWDILNNQGYNLNNLLLNFTEMWTQEHYKYSNMEQHVHSNGSQIVGFYFLKVPEESPSLLFYDPRAGKIQSSLSENNTEDLTLASNIINFKPKEGTLIFTNSWLAHAFTRNISKKPFKFVHFNLKTIDNISNNTEVEIV